MTRAAIALIALALGGCASQTALVSEYAITNAAARCAGLTACSHVYHRARGVNHCNVWVNATATRTDHYVAAYEACFKDQPQ